MLPNIGLEVLQVLTRGTQVKIAAFKDAPPLGWTEAVQCINGLLPAAI